MVAEKENLTVTIDRETNIYINDFQVRMDFLKDKLEKILAGKTDREVFFRADKDVSIRRRRQCDGGNQGSRCRPAGHGDRPLR
jgi:biopolymer transport protein ExbD